MKNLQILIFHMIDLNICVFKAVVNLSLNVEIPNWHLLRKRVS
jgi:hypothetical protein